MPPPHLYCTKQIIPPPPPAGILLHGPHPRHGAVAENHGARHTFCRARQFGATRGVRHQSRRQDTPGTFLPVCH